MGNSRLYNLIIEKILELDNGNIAVVCEQEMTTSYTTQDGSRYYIKVRGSVRTFFVNGNDASIEDAGVIEKVQVHRTSVKNGGTIDVKSVGMSIYPFVYGNKLAYLFNDELNKHVASAKKGDCIVLVTQESGEKAKLNVLSGNKDAVHLVRQILFQEDDRLIVLTRNTKEAYIETLSLP